MKLQRIQNKFLLFILFSIYIIFVCNCFKPDDEEEIRRLLDDLDRKKHEHSDKDGNLQICHVVIQVLIGTNIFFLVIIISCAIYEIINCCMERKRELERKELYIKNIPKSNNSKNFNLKLSNGSSSSIDDEKNAPKVENSFHSSHMSASIKSKVEYNNNSNNVEVQKSNINDSNYFRPRENSGYEAPIVQNIEQNRNNINNKNDIKSNNDYNNFDNDKEQKLLTNDGNGNKENANIKNPYQN